MSGEEDLKFPAAGSSVLDLERPPDNLSQNGGGTLDAQIPTGDPPVAAAAATASKPSPYSIITSSNKATSDESASANKKSASASRKNSSSGDGRSVLDDRWYENLDKLKPCIKDEGVMDYSSITDDKVKQKLMSFTKDQRKYYKMRENNEKCPLTDDRIEALLDANFSFEPIKKRKNADSKPKPKAKRPAKEKSESTTPGKGKVFDSVTTPQMEEEEMARKKSASAKKATLAKSEGGSGELKSDDATPAANASSKKSPASKGSSKKGGKPSYIEMIHEAIVAIKDRTGSSAIAISKWILAHHQHAASINQNMFKSRLNMALKQGLKEERFMKVRASFKISPEWTKKQRAKEAAIKKAEQRKKKELEKISQKKKEEMAKKKAEADKKKKEANMTAEERAAIEDRKKKKEEAEKRKKWISEQLKRRRFPMEDTRLHSENKEWGVRPRKDITRPPALPDTLACIIPPHLRTGERKWSSKNACSNVVQTRNLSELGPDRDRGLVTDVLQVWHFFCGDVGLADENYPVPKFSVKTMFYALDEVLSGNAKAAKALPPLITHLFVTALKMLSAAEDTSSDAEPVDLRLQADLAKLAGGLNAVSWSQIFCYYVELMESYYTSDLSLGPDVLPNEGNLDMSYFWSHVKMDVDNEEPKSGEKFEYNAYIGNPSGVLAKALSKLQRQVEPWALSAEELMAMLRTLTDDILAKRSDLSEDMLGRGAKLYELQKAKRAALVKYNKVRLAYEGPKKPSKPRKTDNDAKKEGGAKGSAGNEGTGNDAKVEGGEEEEDEEEKEEEEKPFVPTATKKQFETAQKAWIKAHEAFENGITKLVSRSEPIGFDRHHNAFYVFRHDPEMVHIERLKPMSLTDELKLLGVELNPFSSWHVIDTKPLFEQFLGCLDDRGMRERETLYELRELTILKRRLHDEKKDNTRAQAREREMEDLQRRLENAKSACDAADGRRSGRLAGNAEDDLKKIEEAIEVTLVAHQEEERQEKAGREKASDYFLLTGLQMVMDLHANVGKKQTRSSRKADDDVAKGNPSISDVTCDKLWWDDKVGGNGTVNVLVKALLEMEDKCNDLSPWKRHDITRDEWRKQLSDASVAWTQDCSMQLGPSADHEDAGLGSLKLSHANIVSSIKGSLKDLEIRVYEISGQKKAVEEADTAGEDGSAQSDDEDVVEQKKRGLNWKMKINALKRVPTPKYTLIRDIIVAAITVARKAHLNQVAADLKAALQLHRPNAAGESKVAAIAVLEKYGGYDASGDEEEDVDFDELAAVDAPAESPDNEVDDAAVTSMLCSEAIMMSGSIGGDDDADPYDWSDAIKECKSLSRLAALTQCFLSKAYDVVGRIELERGELDSLLGVNAKRQTRSKKASTIKKSRDTSAGIWCDSKLTDRLVKAKVTNYPWWPARVCEPLDPLIAEGAKECGQVVISSVGNPGMFLVPEGDVVDFTEDTEDDLSGLNAEVVTSLRESTAIAKKLWRRQNVGMQSPWSKKSRPRFVEEKKTES